MSAIRRALALVAGLGAAYFAYAAIYSIYSRPPDGVWTFAESFESGDLRGIGRPGMRQLCCEHSAQVVSAPVRDGRFAMRVRLDAGDPSVRGNLRAEVRLRSTRLHSENDYAFSVFVPPDWKEDSLETVVAQWHSVPDRWLLETSQPSPLQLIIVRGRWRLSSAWDARPVIRFPLRSGQPRGRTFPLDLPVERGRWVDWSFHVRWAFDGSGLLRVVKDGAEVARRAGPNTYNDAIGPYFKFGLYSIAPAGAAPADTRTICFDAIRVIQGR